MVELRRQSHSQWYEKIPKNKYNQGCKIPVLKKLYDTEERNLKRYK